MVIWVCEASEVNNLTVLAVGPNGRDKNNKDKDDKIASSRSDPPKGSDKNPQYDFPKMRGGGGQRPFGTFPKIHPFW